MTAGKQCMVALGLAAALLRGAHGELIVKGCRQLSYCHGHGMCVSRGKGAPVTSCSCFDGWGSVRDLEYALGPSADCSQRVCPHGPGNNIFAL